jgi:hypothetical protein
MPKKKILGTGTYRGHKVQYVQIGKGPIYVVAREKRGVYIRKTTRGKRKKRSIWSW